MHLVKNLREGKRGNSSGGRTAPERKNFMGDGIRQTLKKGETRPDRGSPLTTDHLKPGTLVRALRGNGRERQRTVANTS